MRIVYLEIFKFDIYEDFPKAPKSISMKQTNTLEFIGFDVFEAPPKAPKRSKLYFHET